KSSHGKILWGYINYKGEWVIQPRYKSSTGFSEGLAAVKINDGSYAYIGHNGHINFDVVPDVTEVGAFSEGLARVRKLNADGYPYYGYIDDGGCLSVSFKYVMAFQFKEGLAVVAIRKKGEVNNPLKYGYIDHSGLWTIK